MTEIKSPDVFVPIHTQTWANGRHNVRCVKVIEETWDVKTFCFNAEQPVIFFFKPGQFVTLELEIDNQQIMRSYTISSSPSVPYSFSITVKRVLGGYASNWLHDNMKIGSELAVHGPVGGFNFIDHQSDKVLFLSGGVGITPVMSMARWCFDTNIGVDMMFVHSARTPKDIIFQRELEFMSSRIDNFNVHLICEKMENGQAWHSYRGFLDLDKLTMISPDFREREIFCCGPTPYMKAIRTILIANGFDMDRYHEEHFGVAPADVVEEAEENAIQALEETSSQSSEDLLEIFFTETNQSVSIGINETVHTAASKLGLHIPKACGMGICGTCKVLKTQGDVVMEHNGGITDEDIEAGYILSCCSVPKEKVVIKF